MNETLDKTNLTLRDRLRAAVQSFGLPRLIIAGFLLLLFIGTLINASAAVVMCAPQAVASMDTTRTFSKRFWT